LRKIGGYTPKSAPAPGFPPPLQIFSDFQIYGEWSVKSRDLTKFNSLGVVFGVWDGVYLWVKYGGDAGLDNFELGIMALTDRERLIEAALGKFPDARCVYTFYHGCDGGVARTQIYGTNAYKVPVDVVAALYSLGFTCDCESAPNEGVIKIVVW
jgi:hypothetical protein